jgi:hypothetical protein
LYIHEGEFIIYLNFIKFERLIFTNMCIEYPFFFKKNDEHIYVNNLFKVPLPPLYNWWVDALLSYNLYKLFRICVNYLNLFIDIYFAILIQINFENNLWHFIVSFFFKNLFSQDLQNNLWKLMHNIPYIQTWFYYYY